MSKQHTPTEYEPFGEDWRKEVMKLPKSFIIEDILKKQCIENIQLKSNHERLIETLEETSAALLQITKLAERHSHLESDLYDAYNAFGSATVLLTELKS